MVIVDTGDVIRLPQDVLIWRDHKVNGVVLTDYLRLPTQRYGFFNEEVSSTVAEIIIDGHAWYVERQDIFEANNSY